MRVGNLNKINKKSFDKECRTCRNTFVMRTPAQLYCSTKCRLDNKRASTYNLTTQEYNSVTSPTVCAICGSTGFKMKEHHNSLLVIDHCHKSGNIRGMLCHNCNRGLGLFQDDTSLLYKAISYLEGAETIEGNSITVNKELPFKGRGLHSKIKSVVVNMNEPVEDTNLVSKAPKFKVPLN